VHSVSIIIPTFNRVSFLELSIASVMAQSFSDWEIVIADDGSTTDTRAFLRSLAAANVRVIELEHTGNPSRARNAAIRAASGQYLAFLDSDDLWKPNKLERQLDSLRTSPGHRWSYTAHDRIDEHGAVLAAEQRTTSAPADGWIFPALLRLDLTIAMPTVVAERALVEEIGGFDEDLLFGEFHDLCLRLAMKSPVIALREPLCSVRAHNQHYSGDRAAALGGWMKLYEKYSRLATQPALRAHCAKWRAITAARIAARLADDGRPAAARAALQDVFAFSWRYPQWWWPATKTLVKTALPPFLLAVMRRRRA
jgi:glycosyltransferase involved in cell wall biosynthesis